MNKFCAKLDFHISNNNTDKLGAESAFQNAQLTHNCHGKINRSRQNFNSTAATKSIFTAENTIFMKQSHSLFHGTNTFSWSKQFFTAQTLSHGTNTFSRQKHFLTVQTLFHGTNTFSRQRRFLTAKTLFHGTNTFSRHKHFFTAKTLSHGKNRKNFCDHTLQIVGKCPFFVKKSPLKAAVGLD